MSTPRYYIIWIEGFDVRSGEKILSISDDGIEYTTSMSRALRVKPRDLLDFVERIRPFVSEWVIKSPSTYVPTEYAKKGTIWMLNGPRTRISNKPPKKNPFGLAALDVNKWTYYGCVIELREDNPDPDERYMVTKNGAFVGYGRFFENAKSICRQFANYKHQ